MRIRVVSSGKRTAVLIALVALASAVAMAASGTGSSATTATTSTTSQAASPAVPSSGVGPVPTAATPAGERPIPVYAYFYQWFTAASWNRAKTDLPVVGPYSSDDAHVLRGQVLQAKAAGIDGFLTSWKSTPALNRRLELLTRIAHSEKFDLGVVYEALDFTRNPLPIATVQADMVHLVDQWGPVLTSSYYQRPLIIWTGTDLYSVADVQQVRDALGARAYLLAASKSVAGYQRLAAIVDGEAYYWSSADPGSKATLSKLLAMGDAVHANHGLWIAPAASGYDGRALGGSRVIDRANGVTLARSLDNAFASSPDGVGVISWNEWSENTYIEPGKRYGTRELDVLTTYLRDRGQGIPDAFTQDDSSTGDTGSGWTGARAAVTLAVLLAVALPGLAVWGRRRNARATTSPASHRSDQPPVILSRH